MFFYKKRKKKKKKVFKFVENKYFGLSSSEMTKLVKFVIEKPKTTIKCIK